MELRAARTQYSFSFLVNFFAFCSYIRHTRPGPITKRISAVPLFKWRDAVFFLVFFWFSLRTKIYKKHMHSSVRISMIHLQSPHSHSSSMICYRFLASLKLWSASIRRFLHRLLHALVQGKVHGFAEEGGLLVVHARGLLLVVGAAQAFALAIDRDMRLPDLFQIRKRDTDVQAVLRISGRIQTLFLHADGFLGFLAFSAGLGRLFLPHPDVFGAKITFEEFQRISSNQLISNFEIII